MQNDVPHYSIIGLCAASFKRPYCQSTCLVYVSVCVSVCLFVRNFDAKYVGN